MIHQPSAGTQGQITDMAIHLKRLEIIKKRMNHIMAENTGRTVEEVTAACERDNFMTAEEAKDMLVSQLEAEVTHESAAKIKEAEAHYKEESDALAREIIGLAIQRCAADHVAEATVSVVPLPSDDMKGRIIAGPEYLTVFNGKTGEAMATVDYIPQRGELKDWGDSYANRSERYLAAIAYLDGVHPSVVMCRGYYAKTVLAAFDWDGKELKTRWVFDSTVPGNEAYGGQGNHNLRVADVDGDGCDEIIYGQMTIDNDGKGLYSTGMYHGDAIHLLSDINDEKYYVWCCHENRKDGSSLRDAATGKVIFQFPSNKDIGRCMAADIDPNHEGVEVWSPNSDGLRSFDGKLISPQDKFMGETKARIPVNFAVWWDGDLLREMLDRNVISKYNWNTGNCDKILTMEGTVWNNGTKANPCLSGDILGDWREEVLMRTEDNQNLRLYVTSIPTDYRFHTFLEDPAYRVSIANQNVAYNQPPEAGFYFGPDLKKGKKFRGTTIK